MHAASSGSDEQIPAPRCGAPGSLARLISILLISLAARSSTAQESQVAWGRIPAEDLAMTSFPADPNARAVILYDFGEFNYDRNDEPVLSRHRRIKILAETAYDDWGTVHIPFYAGDQKVSEIQARTFVRAPDGSERQVDLDPASIFEEKVTGKLRRLRFTMPGLAPGCVIEYRYRISPAWLGEWVFQWGEPTRWSEFRAERPKSLEYAMVQQGIVGFHVEEAKEIPDPADRYRVRIAHRWVLRDLPALRREPFMTTPDDFRATLRFQRARWMDSGGLEHEILGTWDKLAGTFLDSKDFGGLLNLPGPLRKKAKELARDQADPVEIMRRVHGHVRSTLTWNGQFDAFADGTLDEALSARRGNSAVFGLLLTGMLRAAGLAADPVLVSTRDHGRVVDVFPLARQFNHVLAHVQVDKREYLLDATDPMRPWNLLPEAAMNGTGFLVAGDESGWVDITSPMPSKNRTTVSATLAGDGTITGWFESQDEGYRALDARHALRGTKQEDEYVRKRWLADWADARLDSITVSNRDSVDAPLAIRAWFTAVGLAQAAGDKIYLNPHLFNRWKENPLTLRQRSFPVDFAYRWGQDYTLQLALPEGYQVEERPQEIRIDLERDGGHFARTVQAGEGGLRLATENEIRKPVFRPDEYRSLRGHFDRLVAAQGEQLVLAKTATAGAAR